MPEFTDLPVDTPPLALRLDRELQQRGASFLVALDLQTEIAAPHEVEAALEYLVWHGRITNDTVAYLRGIRSQPRRDSAKRKVRMQRQAGRWSSTLSLSSSALNSADILIRSQALLDCFAVVSRDLGRCVGGGYSELAAVYRTMEDQGKLRRGHFVSELEGVQYCRSGIVDNLRSLKIVGGQILAACDPANPWGNQLSWPAGVATRRAGATLLSWQGQPVCFLESGRKKLSTFVRDERLDEVITHLFPRLANEKSLSLSTIDGQDAASSPLAERFERCEWRKEQATLVLERYR